jgi:WD40 repeat protein
MRIVLAVVSLLTSAPGLCGQSLKARCVGTILRDGVENYTEQPIRCLAFTPDGKSLFSAGRGIDTQKKEHCGEVRIWDCATGKVRGVFTHPKDGFDYLLLSPDGTTLLTGSSEPRMQLWDVPLNRQPTLLKVRATLTVRPFHLVRAAFGPDGKRLALAGQNEVNVWDIAAAKEVSSFKRLVAGSSAAFSPDLATLASANYQDVDLWDVPTGKLRATLPDHRGAVQHLAFSADGKTLAVGCCRLDDDEQYVGQIKLWDPAAGKECETLKDIPGHLSGMALSPDGKLLLVQKEKVLLKASELHLYAVPGGRLLDTVSFKTAAQSPSCLAFSPDGKFLATGCQDGSIRLWELCGRD